MMDDFIIGAKLGELVDRVVQSYQSDARTQRIDKRYLPSRVDIVRVTEDLLELLYPGLIGRQHLTVHNVGFHVGDLLPRIAETLCQQILSCLCYAREQHEPNRSDDECDAEARKTTLAFLESIPKIRTSLAGDVQATFDGDPAAVGFDEIVLSYPGLLAISVHRMAHALYEAKVPLMPRIMAEWVHAKTGIDIHPGANIGRNFFIDHGTGVVIGETTDIGDNVKIYQGVTLGALSFPKDDRGRIIRGTKRHPRVGDNVTLYANAIILGGETIIGDNSVIGGSVFVTTSVPPDSVVTFKPPELRMKSRVNEGARPIDSQDSTSLDDFPDYCI